MEVGFKTDKGKMRSNNEDACFVMKNDNVFIVADGVGGNQSGEIASRTAVTCIAEYIEKHTLRGIKTREKIKKYFTTCMDEANNRIMRSSVRFEQNRGMATTIVVGYIDKDKLYVFNIGDSRAYILRNSDLIQITEDHTYVNSLVKAGVITEEEARFHAKRNMITKAIGAEPNIIPDMFVESLKKGDFILFCTDGLYGELSKDEIIDIIHNNNDMVHVCEELTDQANHNGGSDNITIICIRITEDDVNE